MVVSSSLFLLFVLFRFCLLDIQVQLVAFCYHKRNVEEHTHVPGGACRRRRSAAYVGFQGHEGQNSGQPWPCA